ncbi:hypothetical protein PC116_g23107 [Phytophthora cactorum]|uniref:Uncharacterized protein n=1 Tax=Phytophthora cactorum TaxID=29920 RepID=A0A8T1JUS3_9STRA|nr:hypothetical protein PC114_g11438 [Phytophthora cactorum]KAG2906231.1 hypothetical protein PC117_g20560 [Phytophthora cactorum]KAG2977687.1 hypothetical protein PC119_g21916 [Phytophthora cactorum]KAG3020359.1 hypothetical protein PC120_g9310 [Phytophthora cactorum]KAG3167360.1 hypothetical protein C6341_g11738 [Phytophthora cactorum]
MRKVFMVSLFKVGHNPAGSLWATATGVVISRGGFFASREATRSVAPRRCAIPRRSEQD